MIPFERSEEYYKAFGTAVNQFVDSLKCPDDKILGIGLAVQGLVSRDGQTIINGDILGYTGTDRSVFQKNIRLTAHCSTIRRLPPLPSFGSTRISRTRCTSL